MARPPVKPLITGAPAAGLRVRRVVAYSRLADQFLADAYEALVPGMVIPNPDEVSSGLTAAPGPARPAPTRRDRGR
jgi:hypothetical protein